MRAHSQAGFLLLVVVLSFSPCYAHRIFRRARRDVSLHRRTPAALQALLRKIVKIKQIPGEGESIEDACGWEDDSVPKEAANVDGAMSNKERCETGMADCYEKCSGNTNVEIWEMCFSECANCRLDYGERSKPEDWAKPVPDWQWNNGDHVCAGVQNPQAAISDLCGDEPSKACVACAKECGNDMDCFGECDEHLTETNKYYYEEGEVKGLVPELCGEKPKPECMACAEECGEDTKCFEDCQNRHLMVGLCGKSLPSDCVACVKECEADEACIQSCHCTDRCKAVEGAEFEEACTDQCQECVKKNGFFEADGDSFTCMA